MPIKIHHGPPGSYKTAGALADDFLREAKAGRVIVTNVRGLSRERTLEQFPDLPPSFDVIHVDDKTSEGRKKWATWFHWMPHGAFIFLDEVQDLWPKSWREADIRKLDYPGGVDQATKDDRPKDWEQALDKHRHYNWDMTLTTPSYAKVRDDVKGIADMAYKHKNLALVGWTGRYIEGAHMADDTGKNANDFISIGNKKVPKYVFTLYDSTQTGIVSDTKSGVPLWKNPRVLLILGILVACVAYVASKPVPKIVGGSGAAGGGQGVGGVGPVPPSGAGAGGGVSGAAVQPVGIAQSPDLEPLASGDPYIVVSYKTGIEWKYAVHHNHQDLTNGDLLAMGYTIETMGSCGLKIRRGQWQRVISCQLPKEHIAPQLPALRPVPDPVTGFASLPEPSHEIKKPEPPTQQAGKSI